jgi:lipid-A-disaccharide synthase
MTFNFTNDKEITVYLIAGEFSGDQLGASLMKGFKLILPKVSFIGVGGPAMQKEGLTSLFPMEDLAVMGLAEVFPRIPLLLRRIKQTINNVIETGPDCLVTIDAPDFCFRVSRKLKGKGIPLIHYVAPSVWAWRPGRARKIAGFLDHLLALLPFEPPYFEKEGLKCSFIGHPILESDLDQGNAATFRSDHNIDQDTQLLCLLPGSRKSEIEQLLPVFCDAYLILKNRIKNLHMVIPTVSTTHDLALNMLQTRGITATVIPPGHDKADAYKACHVALAASGTVSLELAFAKVPAVIAYKVSVVTAFVAKIALRNTYYSLINLILDRMACPENMQENCTPEILANDVEALFTNEQSRLNQLESYEEALLKLGRGQVRPGKMAAQRVLETIADFKP